MSKRNKIIYWIATVWLSLGMVSTGLVQLSKAPTGPGGTDMMAHLGYPNYLSTLIGVFKILGAIAILAPKLPVLKEWAYAGFFFIMSGAIFSHVVNSDSIKEIFPALLLIALTLISWYFRPPNRKIVLVSRS